MMIIIRSKWKILIVDSWHLFKFIGMIWLLDCIVYTYIVSIYVLVHVNHIQMF